MHQAVMDSMTKQAKRLQGVKVTLETIAISPKLMVGIAELSETYQAVMRYPEHMQAYIVSLLAFATDGRLISILASSKPPKSIQFAMMEQWKRTGLFVWRDVELHTVR
jgi:hypothetical protein